MQPGIGAFVKCPLELEEGGNLDGKLRQARLGIKSHHIEKKKTEKGRRREIFAEKRSRRAGKNKTAKRVDKRQSPSTTVPPLTVFRASHGETPGTTVREVVYTGASKFGTVGLLEKGRNQNPASERRSDGWGTLWGKGRNTMRGGEGGEEVTFQECKNENVHREK